MKKNPLVELNSLGQSFWLDYISRDLIKSGKLKALIENDGLRGLTTNPSIFYKSIKDSIDYNDQIKYLLSNKDLTEKELFYELEIQDVIEASDILKPVYESSDGKDGYISIEVDPNYAYDTDNTIREAKELFSRINRQNIMIKIPATREGLPAIRQLISEGYNINVTLLFSVKRYEEVVDAYLEGLEERLKKESSIDSVASVASFFVSRVDTLTDKIIDEKIKDILYDDEKELFESLKGKTAVANAKMAYQAMVTNFSSERFLNIKENGGRIQRLLWASTSAKNPDYSDLLYVDELIGPNTVNTMPPATLEAFKNHGVIKRTVDQDLNSTMEFFESLLDAGINIDNITERLENEGVRLFIESFNSLLDLLSEKRKV